MAISDIITTFATELRNKNINQLKVYNNMNKFRINRIYVAFTLFSCACGYCVVNDNPYQNVLILGLAFILWFFLVCMTFEKPTNGEKKVINKFSHLA